MRVFDLEEELKTISRDLLVLGRQYADLHRAQLYFRDLIRMHSNDMQELLQNTERSRNSDSIWTNWDFD
jgi:hypothetical protein